MAIFNSHGVIAVASQETGPQGLGTGFQGDALQRVGLSYAVPFHHTVTGDLFAIDIQVLNNSVVIQTAEEGLAFFRHGDGVIPTVKMTAEGGFLCNFPGVGSTGGFGRTTGSQLSGGVMSLVRDTYFPRKSSPL